MEWLGVYLVCFATAVGLFFGLARAMQTAKEDLQTQIDDLKRELEEVKGRLERNPYDCGSAVI